MGELGPDCEKRTWEGVWSCGSGEGLKSFCRLLLRYQRQASTMAVPKNTVNPTARPMMLPVESALRLDAEIGISEGTMVLLEDWEEEVEGITSTEERLGESVMV